MCIFSQLLQSLCMIYNSHSHFFAKLVFILVWFTLCDFTCPHFFHLFPQLSQGSLFRSVDHFMFPCMCSFISLSPTILTIKTFQDHCDPLDVHLVCHFFPQFSQSRLTVVWIILCFLTILTTKIALCFFKCFFKCVFSPHFSPSLSQERLSSSVYHFVLFDICSLFHLFHTILTITSLHNHVIQARQPMMESPCTLR